MKIVDTVSVLGLVYTVQEVSLIAYRIVRYVVPATHVDASLRVNENPTILVPMYRRSYSDWVLCTARQNQTQHARLKMLIRCIKIPRPRLRFGNCDWSHPEKILDLDVTFKLKSKLVPSHKTNVETEYP
jgi:hypothetical protein